MSWYSQMFKSHEAARERNRREQRRFQLDLNQRHGIEFVARYRIEEVNKEQRLIEKELERIRQGIHKKPMHDDSQSDPSAESQKTSLLTVLSPRQGQTKALVNPVPVETSKKNGVSVTSQDSTDSSQDTTALYKAIVYLQSHPLALEPYIGDNASSSAKETVQTLRFAQQPSAESKSPRNVPDVEDKFVPGYLKKTSEKSKTPEKYNKYSALLRSPSPVLLKRHPGNSRRHEQQDSEASTARSPRKPPDIVTLATEGMQNARENANRRLSNKDYGGESEQGGDDGAEGKVKDKRATKAALFPTTDADNYNPDGTLRTQYCMPSFEKRWDEAEKARYIRNPQQLERDKEIPINEIFSKK